MGRPTFLRLLERWPTAESLVSASRDELVALARSSHHGWPQRFADQVGTALAADHFVARDYLVRAKAGTIALSATQLLAIGAQRRVRERRMGALLLGAPRHSRRPPKEDERGQAVPGREIYLSFAGLGIVSPPGLLVRSGDICNFESPNGLQCYAGKAPVTRRSGKSEWWPAAWPATATWRTPCSNGRSAASTNPVGPGGQRSRGKGHNAALRALGNPWLEVLWHCLRKGVRYDEALHVANRNRALRRVGGKAA